MGNHEVSWKIYLKVNRCLRRKIMSQRKSPTELAAEILTADVEVKGYGDTPLINRYEILFNKILECRKKEDQTLKEG